MEFSYLQENLTKEKSNMIYGRILKKDISHFETKNFNISEDQTLIYAIALGLPMEKLDDYRQSVNLDYYPMYWGYWYFLTSKKKVVHYLKIELLEASMAILELLPLLPLVVGGEDLVEVAAVEQAVAVLVDSRLKVIGLNLSLFKLTLLIFLLFYNLQPLILPCFSYPLVTLPF